MLEPLFELLFEFVVRPLVEVLLEALLHGICFVTGRLAAALAFFGKKTSSYLSWTADDYTGLGFVIWFAIALIAFGCCAWKHRHSDAERPRRTASFRLRIGGKGIFKWRSHSREVAPAS
jgi:hypothetical protein